MQQLTTICIFSIQFLEKNPLFLFSLIAIESEFKIQFII